ncbi:MAG: (2Fe-2S) ferredoxin domain-containing protein [Gammaproteobacteria bacterium]|nr:(2Fe-2S) ferredoxin domain-containing protein [Gammaproteobacteria bacterium]
MSAAGGWRLLICVNRRLNPETPSCAARGSETLAARLEGLLDARGLDVPVESILCFGACSRGPNIRIAPGGAFFHGVGENDLPAIVDAVAAAVASGPPEAC